MKKLEALLEAPIGSVVSDDTVEIKSSDHKIVFSLTAYGKGGYALAVRQAGMSHLTGGSGGSVSMDMLKKVLVSAVEAFERQLRIGAGITF